MAVRTTLKAAQLPDNLENIRNNIEHAVPHGKQSGKHFIKGAWKDLPDAVHNKWFGDKQALSGSLHGRFQSLAKKHRAIAKCNHAVHLGTLGGGNHFVEVCLDEEERVWVMLHSGSRGVGNRIGSYFIRLAKEDMRVHLRNLPDADLAYFHEAAPHFADYIEAVQWAQDYALANREVMMQNVLRALKKTRGLAKFKATEMAVNCHHNYVSREHHYGEDVFVTRKGAVSAREGEMGIIPGSMGAKSFIVRGKGSAESFHSCSHGAGRLMSRSKAKETFTLKDHRKATEGVACRKDRSVIDETPGAYKNIDDVMAAQCDAKRSR